MLENWNKIYNEPKHIGDIIKDMKMDPESIEHQIKIKISSKKFAEEIVQTFQRYADAMDKLIPLYAETSKIIMDIDHYYTEEKANFWRAKLSIQEWRMNQKDINERIHAIEIKSDSFEFDQADINMSLRKIIRKFPCSKDKLEHTKKANAFCKLFMNIYTDLDHLCVAYGQLLRKAKI